MTILAFRKINGLWSGFRGLALGMSIFVLHAACSSTLIASESPRLGEVDRYYQLLDRTEQQYAQGDIEGVSESLDAMLQLRVGEVPTYERHFFRAVILRQQHQDAEALALLSAFRDMLRIDSGEARCTTTNGMIVVNGALKSSTDAFRAMCWEGYLAYYERPSIGTLRRVSRYWSLADDLREKLESKP